MYVLSSQLNCAIFSPKRISEKREEDNMHACKVNIEVSFRIFPSILSYLDILMHKIISKNMYKTVVRNMISLWPW